MFLGSLPNMWFMRRGCFLRTFTRGLGLGEVSGLATRLTEWQKEKRRRKERGQGHALGSLLLFKFIGSLQTHPHVAIHSYTAEASRQSQDVTSSTGRKTKQFFFMLFCAAEQSQSSTRTAGWPSERQHWEQPEREQLALTSTGSIILSEQLSTTSQPLRWGILVRYSAESFIHSLNLTFFFWFSVCYPICSVGVVLLFSVHFYYSGVSETNC